MRKLRAALFRAYFYGLTTLPFAAAAIGWLTAHVTVRSSLSVLP